MALELGLKPAQLYAWRTKSQQRQVQQFMQAVLARLKRELARVERGERLSKTVVAPACSPAPPFFWRPAFGNHQPPGVESIHARSRARRVLAAASTDPACVRRWGPGCRRRPARRHPYARLIATVVAFMAANTESGIAYHHSSRPRIVA